MWTASDDVARDPGGEPQRRGSAPLDLDDEERRTSWVGRSPFEENVLSVMAPSGTSVMGAADFRLITDSLPHLVWMAGPDGLIDYFNRQCAIYAGCGLEPNGGWNGAALIHPDDVDRVLLAWRVSTQLTTPYNQDCRIRRRARTAGSDTCVSARSMSGPRSR